MRLWPTCRLAQSDHIICHQVERWNNWSARFELVTNILYIHPGTVSIQIPTTIISWKRDAFIFFTFDSARLWILIFYFCFTMHSVAIILHTLTLTRAHTPKNLFRLVQINDNDIFDTRKIINFHHDPLVLMIVQFELLHLNYTRNQ